MSVLKARRSESRAEYVNVAKEIFQGTIDFLSRLSARYSRLMAPSVSGLASKVLEHAEVANSIYPTDKVKCETREYHLVEARGALMALDVELAQCYEIMMKNPEGCFTGVDGKRSVAPAEAKRELENMAQRLGELIDEENSKLTGVMKSDKERLKAAKRAAKKAAEEISQEGT